MSDYPEHEKLRAIKERSQAIGEFLDFSKFTLCEFREAGDNGEPRYVWRDDYDPPDGAEPNKRDFLSGRAESNPAREDWGEGYYPTPLTIDAILTDWFGIDQDKIETEKRAMLDALRKANK